MSACDNIRHVGPVDSRDTCAACLYDEGDPFHVPGTPIPLWYSGCQDCYWDHRGRMRCRGCWGPWDMNVPANPQWSHITPRLDLANLA